MVSIEELWEFCENLTLKFEVFNGDMQIILQKKKPPIGVQVMVNLMWIYDLILA